jgi:hypothetical protein
MLTRSILNGDAPDAISAVYGVQKLTNKFEEFPVVEGCSVVL